MSAIEKEINELICPKCKNENGTTSFVQTVFDENNHPLEIRECDDESCGCVYHVRYKVDSIEIVK